MREILFRGKRKDNGEWVCWTSMGKLQFSQRGKLMSGTIGLTDWAYELLEIDDDTVGQYIGMNDKNGKRIFEGDVVAQNWYSYNEPTNDSFGEVLFCESDCSFSVLDVERREVDALGRCGEYHWEIEVIGNIHDNPELLKGG